MTTIKLNTGLRPFDIQFDEDEIKTIYFNPTDADLPKRMLEAQKMIEEKTKNIKDAEIDENGLPSRDEYIAVVDEVNKAICDTVDHAFGNKISDIIFGKCSPLSITNSEYFIIQFFNAIAPVLQSIIEKESKKANAHIEKHLKKYMK